MLYKSESPRVQRVLYQCSFAPILLLVDCRRRKNNIFTVLLSSTLYLTINIYFFIFNNQHLTINIGINQQYILCKIVLIL